MIFVTALSTIVLGIIFAGRYFASVEFWLYPYLISRGLVPYRDLIDQHFPGVLFGPISFATFGVENLYTALLGQGLLVIGLITAAYIWFCRVFADSHKAMLATAILIGSYYLLEGNYLWIEQWSLLALMSAANLGQRKRGWSTIAGVLIAFAVMNRPFAVGFGALVFLISQDKKSLITGILGYMALVVFWFWYHGNFGQFLYLLEFSKTTYLQMAASGPDKREAIWLAMSLIPVLFFLKRQPVVWLAAGISALCIWPRFEFYHLSLILMGMMFIKSCKKAELAGAFLIVWLLVFAKATPFENDNFYASPANTQLALIVDTYQTPTVYLFGGPDQAYVLAQTLPPNKYYLPSLPWYHSRDKFVNEQIEALEKSKGELVVINKNSVVDGKNLTQVSSKIYNYILTSYKKAGSWEDFDFYLESETVVLNK